jgi:vacuolar-type H+-ATPase subunit C/Vma6
MCDLLKFESDARTIQIVANSLNFRDMRSDQSREHYRTKFMCNLGYLYPERYNALKSVSDAKTFREALDCSPYAKLVEDINLGVEDQRHEAESSEPKLDEIMLAEASRRFSMAFEN